MTDYVSGFVSASDGLRLHTRHYGDPLATRSTIVCLPGLARTAADFDALARALVAASTTPRRVLALDYRGRGESAWDPNPDRYDLMVEADDVGTVLTASGVSEAVLVGTSRGGLLTMILAALRPTLIRGAVLNDIGPVIEPAGLARIRGYVGKLPRPTSWAAAVEVLRQVAGSQFTALAEADWDAYARATFEERDGALVARYDPALIRSLEKLDLAAVPTLWPQFDGLGHVPVLVVRGENSDLLSAATVAAMVERHPDCSVVTVPGQGHAPLLTDAPTIERIVDFVAACEDPDRSPAAGLRGLSMLAS